MENGRKQPFFLFPACSGFFGCEGTLPQFHTHAAQTYEIATFFCVLPDSIAEQVRLSLLLAYDAPRLTSFFRFAGHADGVAQKCTFSSGRVRLRF